MTPNPNAQHPDADPKGPDAPDVTKIAEDDSEGDFELDPDEAADAFEELDESLRDRRDDAPERQDEDIVTLDTPD